MGKRNKETPENQDENLNGKPVGSENEHGVPTDNSEAKEGTGELLPSTSGRGGGGEGDAETQDFASPPQAEGEQEELLETETAEQKPLIQLHRKFIVTTLRSGLMIIHQQLAHERILFERYMSRLQNGESYSQHLLFPEVLEMEVKDFQLLKELLPEVSALGFELQEFGKNAFLLNGVPIDIRPGSEKKLLEKLLEEYKNAGQLNTSKEENIAKALARSAAIPVGRSLTHEEMKQLIDELFACAMPYYSPDGKPVLITIAADELDKKFRKM